MSDKPIVGGICHRCGKERSLTVVGAEDEVERLNGELQRLSDHYQKLMVECDEKQAEVERLRALILDYCQASTPGEVRDALLALHSLAKEQT